MENEINTNETVVDSGYESYMNSVHRDGKVWGLILCVLICSVPVILGLVFNAVPNWEALGKGVIATLPLYWAVGLIEVFTYTPMLGAGGTYLSFVTGNISNLKLPCAINALEANDVKASTEEGELISTIVIAVSSIVTMLIIILGVALMGILQLDKVLSNPNIKPAFDQMIPALFGALGVVFLSRNIKIALPTLVLMLILFIFIPALDASTVGIMVPVGVVITILYARILYKAKKI